jgi:hypothetical protein
LRAQLIFLCLFSDKILSHIYRASNEDNKTLDDVLKIGVDTKKGKTDEYYSQKHDTHYNAAYLTDTADE